MKLSNCVVGQVIEAKRNVRGHSNERIPKGLQVKVDHVCTYDYYPLRVKHPGIDCGFAWVNPADFRKVVQEVQPDDAVPADVQKGTKVVCIRDFVEPRFGDTFTVGVVYEVRQDGLDHDGELRLKHPSLDCGHGYGKPQNFRLYKEPQEAVVPKKPVLTEECTKQNLQVGDTVLVGTNGAGYNLVLPEYAGLTCEVTHVHFDGSVDINHPDVPQWGNGYRSRLKHLTKIVKEPVVEPVVQEFQEGDVLECITDCEGEYNEKCVAGRLYRFSRYCKHDGRDEIQVHDPDLWFNHALVLPENFKLYARVKPEKDSTDADTPTA